MKKVLIMLILQIFIVRAFSQNSLHGIISDRTTGASLPNATLYFTDLMKGVSADLDGRYNLGNLPQGSYLLEVTYLGYRSFVEKVQIAGNTELNISLMPAAAEMKEVIITGTASSIERRLNPFPSIILNSDDLHIGNSSNLVDALSHHPGISQVTTGTGISKPVIRGLGYNRVVELVDGIRQEDQQWGDEHGVEVDDFSISRIEVIKGPGSVMYGSDAMAGVINFLNPVPLQEGKVELNMISEYQTNNHLAGVSFNNQGNLKGINWSLRTSAKAARNYQNGADGSVFNSGYHQLNTNGYLGLNRRWGYSQIQFSVFNESLGLTEGDRDSLGRFVKPLVLNDSLVSEIPVSGSELNSYSISVPWQKLIHWKLVSSSSFSIGKSRASIKIAFQQNRRSEMGDPVHPDKASMFLRLNTVTYDLKYFLTERNNWETSAGVGGMFQQNRDAGNEYLIPEYDLLDGGLFLFTRKTIHNLNISGGARVDMRRISSFGLLLQDEGQKFSAFSRTFSNFSGSFGLSYQFNDSLVVKLNVSRGFRAPNIAELASNGKHEGTYRYELGNSGLRPETSFQADAGLDIDKTHLSFEADLFLNSIHNYIYPEKLNSIQGSDSIVNSKDPAPAFRFIQGDAMLYGGEMTLDVHPHPYDWIHFENSVSYVRGIRMGADDSLRNLPLMPPLKITSQLRVNINRTPSWLKNLSISAGVEVSFKQDRVYSAYGTESPTPGYALVNAGLEWDIYRNDTQKLLSVILSGNNLMDVKYQDHLSRLKYAPENPLTGQPGIYNMGRNVGFKILVPISL